MSGTRAKSLVRLLISVLCHCGSSTRIHIDGKTAEVFDIGATKRFTNDNATEFAYLEGFASGAIY